jgi:S-adenosylmethionine decarboxylase
MRGIEWVIDAHGCDSAALADVVRLRALFDRLIAELHLTPVADPAWHAFAATGGITGFVMLAESHLACHTFPEFGSICLNVFCCRARADWDAERIVAEALGAQSVVVRRLERDFGAIVAPESVRSSGS